MAVHFNCKCPERNKPVTDRAWVVTEYKWNSGAFTSGDGEPSDYSEIKCLECGCRGRSKAQYVYKLDHMGWSEARKEWLRRSNIKSTDYD